MPIHLLQGTRFRLKRNGKDAVIVCEIKMLLSPFPTYFIIDEDGREGGIPDNEIDWKSVSKEDINRACGIK